MQSLSHVTDATKKNPNAQERGEHAPVQRKAGTDVLGAAPYGGGLAGVFETGPLAPHPVQARRDDAATGAVQAQDGPGSTASVHAIAQQGFQGPAGTLPYLGTIQASFGHHDVSGVKAYEAPAATRAMGATAYASGNQVAFAGPTDLHTAAHEAAHVVQQRGGVQLAGGVGRAGDAYERHADAVADRVVAGRSATDLLDQKGPKAAGTPGVQQKGAPVQKVAVDGGAYGKANLKFSFPIYGPLKGFVDVSVSYQVGSDGTEVSGAVFAGIELDLFFVKLFAGIEGSVKFKVKGVTDPVTAIRRGIEEICKWQAAKNVIDKLADKKKTIEAKYQSSYSMISTAFLILRNAIKNGQGDAVAAQLQDKWGIDEFFTGKTFYDIMDSYLEDYKGTVADSFGEFGVKTMNNVISANSLQTSVGKLRTAVDAMVLPKDWLGRTSTADVVKANTPDDKGKTPAQKAREAALVECDKSSAFILGELSAAHSKVTGQLNSVGQPVNDPDVGFEASVVFKAGASVQATKKVSGGLTFSTGVMIKDDTGKTSWDTKAQQVTKVEGKLNIDWFEVNAGATWMGNEFALTVGAFASKNKAWGKMARDKYALKTFGQNVSKLAKTFSTLKPGASAVSMMCEAIITQMKGDLAKLNYPLAQTQGAELGGKAGVELEFKWAQGNLAGFTIKGLAPNISLTAEKFMGKTSAIGLTGGAEVGGYVLVTII